MERNLLPSSIDLILDEAESNFAENEESTYFIAHEVTEFQMDLSKNNHAQLQIEFCPLFMESSAKY